MLFASRLDAAADAAVASVGTAALVDRPIDPPSLQALAEFGVDGSRHRGRQYTPEIVARADLVLTAERRHRDRVLTDVPSALRRTFTMREFARLAPHLHAGTPEDVIAEAGLVRAMFGRVPPRYDDVPDPFGAPLEKAREVAALISDTVWATVTALGLADPAQAAAARAAAREPGRVPPPREATS
jgi:protein-tyrosine phosphatase